MRLSVAGRYVMSLGQDKLPEALNSLHLVRPVQPRLRFLSFETLSQGGRAARQPWAELHNRFAVTSGVCYVCLYPINLCRRLSDSSVAPEMNTQ
jgi:hypothetical protein